MAGDLDHTGPPPASPPGVEPASPRRPVLDAAVAAPAWLGRQGTRAIAALVFIGIAAPPIDAWLKPFVTEAIFVLLCIAFLRVDPGALRSYLGRPPRPWS